MIISAATNMLVISAVCTGIIVLLIIVRKVFDKYTYTGWRVALWMIILIRLCVPYMAQSPIGIIGNNRSYETSGVNAFETADVEPEIAHENAEYINDADIMTQTTPTAMGSKALSVADIFGYIYASGFIFTFIMLIAKSIISKLHVRNLPVCTNTKINTLLNELKNEMGIKRKVNVLLDKDISVPMVYGVFSSQIILPEADRHKDADSIKIILAHELTHIKQMDIAKLWLMEIALCFNWFNPFMWIFKRLIIKDLEIACDQKVLASGEDVNPYDYSMIITHYSTLPKSRGVLSASIGFTVGKSKLLKERLSTISRMKGRKLKSPGIIICMCICVLLIACTSTGINIKDSLDLRDSGVVIGPQNQGQYSTGAVFAAIGITESYIAVNTGELVDLSEQQFIDDTNYIKQNFGVSPEKVLDYIIQNGIVTEQALPYTGVKGDGYSEISESETLYNIPAFDSIYLSGLTYDEQVDIVKDSLQKYGVLMTNIGYYKSMDNYDGGVYQSDNAEEPVYGHWVNIVGFADDENLPSGGYWIVKESWGTNWGEGGYIKIPYNDPCGINDYILYFITEKT